MRHENYMLRYAQYMTEFNPNLHHRRSIRLAGYDYSQSGAYFVTICTVHRACLLGEVLDGEMTLSTLGCVVDECWLWLQNQYEFVELDTYVIMPNHLHGVIFILDSDYTGGSRTAPTKRKPLGGLIGAFKTTSTKRVNSVRQTPGLQIWQRNYYEHIIRNEADLNRIREYIHYNPAQWAQDSENPSNAR